MTNRPFCHLEKGNEESAAHSDSLSNSKKSEASCSIHLAAEEELYI